MNYKTLECPHCGKKIRIEEGENVFLCPYCEKKVTLSGGNDGGAPTASDKRKSRKKKNTLIALFVTLGVLLLIVAVAYIFRHQIINFFTEPEQHPATADKVWTSVPPESDTAPSTDTSDLSDVDRVYNILICGQDKISGLTDVNMIVNFNVSKLTLSVMQIPRDTNMSHDGFWYPRANGIFNYFRGAYGGCDSDIPYVQSVLDKYDLATEADLRGIAGYAALLEQSLCIKIHYFAVMDLSGFRNIVDALGGVYMNVPFDLEYVDPNQDLEIHVSKGYQLLDGKAAEGVVRYREGYAMADIGRGNVQKMFLASLAKTIQDRANIFNFGELCGIIMDNLVTNMTTSDLIYFANNAMTLDLQYVTMMTVPVGGFIGDDGMWYTCLNRDGTLKYINGYFNIFDEPVMDDEFDQYNVFYMDSVWYSGPSSMIPEYIYKGSDMVSDDFRPVVGY